MIDVNSDLFHDERAEFFEILPYVKNPIFRAIRKIHCSGRVSSVVKLPFRDKWHSTLDDYPWESDVEYHIVFLGCPFIKRSISYWLKYKKEHNVKFSMYELNANDSFAAKAVNQLEAINEFDRKIGFEHILTAQLKEADKYGYIHCYHCCSMIDGNSSDVIENDMYLINNAKGRLKKFLDVYECARNNGVNSFFRIAGVKKKDQLYSDEIIYNKLISYKEVVKEIKKSNCLFEVLGGAQTGASMHYFEAVIYNKKLLTDNKNAAFLPYYNPKFVHFYDNPKDINWDWVKERVPVDYHYDGGFSPTHLIDKIIELEEDKDKKESIKQ